MGGLLSGLLLARAGNDVRVIERDAAPPPDADTEAWERWDRPGVTQFRQPHGLSGALRALLVTELPDVWQQIEATSPTAMTSADFAPDPSRVDEESRQRLVNTIVRRTTMERIVASAAAEEPLLDVIRGDAVTAVSARRNGRVRVTGVETAHRGALDADLVIDSSGRRTAAPRWLGDHGAAAETWSESDGFTYHSRWYRLLPGQKPSMRMGMFGGFAPGLMSILFPGDGAIFSIAMVGLGRDKPLRRLRDPEIFQRVASKMPGLANWVDLDVSEPITPVIPMASIQNRSLRFALDGRSSVVGFVNLGDSYVSTNPSLGRGVGLAALMARDLRDLLAASGDPTAVTDEFDQLKELRYRPWLHDAVQSDADTRALFEAMTGFGERRPRSARALVGRASMVDMGIWERWTSANHLFEPVTAIYGDPAIVEHARTVTADMEEPVPAFDRDGLLTLLSA